MTDDVFDASELFDELRGEALPFRLGGEMFRLPPPTTWSDAVIRAADSGQVIEAAEGILGAEDYARFVAAGGNALFLQRLVEKLYGAALGESSGSSKS